MEIAQIPDDIRLLNVFGAEYYMPWEEMPVGASVFLPTTALDRQVAKKLRRVERYLDWKFAVRQRCEFGIFGVRVWRVY
jgi:hypothetical protein